MSITRRDLVSRAAILGSAAFIGGCAGSTATNIVSSTSGQGFVTQSATGLAINGSPYRFTGANMWYAAWLGADAPFGNRARLGRELDRLKAMGATNIRIMASAEEGPLKNSIKPGFRDASGTLNQTLSVGLDFAVTEIAKRGMKSVLCLTNFWEWSGGMMTLIFHTTGKYINNGDPAHPWPDFADETAKFYANGAAVERYLEHVEAMVKRVNSITGVAYVNDPSIMSWQLCNEPRPGGRDDVIARNVPAYLSWINRTATLIRSIDKNHLVSLGHEGTIGTNGRRDILIAAHEQIDYLTAHIWPLNWGWVDGKNLAGTWDAGYAKVVDYLNTHIEIASQMKKPLLIEEFGFPRDGELYSPESTTEFKRRYYETIFNAAERSLATGGPIAGTNFWAWNGEARASHPDYRFRDGDLGYMGDPPHEPQGWYGLFDTDKQMTDLVRSHANKFATTPVA